MAVEQLFPEIICALWYRAQAGLDERGSGDRLPPLTPQEVAALGVGLAAALHSAELFDPLFEFYLNASDGRAEPDSPLPLDLRHRFFRQGPAALTPHELVGLATTPVWLAELRDAVAADPDAADTGGPADGSNPYLGLARAEVRRAVAALAPRPAEHAVVGAVRGRLLGSVVGAPEHFARVYEAVDMAVRELDSRPSQPVGPEVKTRCVETGAKGPLASPADMADRPTIGRRYWKPIAMFATAAAVAVFVFRQSGGVPDWLFLDAVHRTVVEDRGEKAVVPSLRITACATRIVGPDGARSAPGTPYRPLAVGEEKVTDFELSTPRAHVLIFQIDPKSKELHPPTTERVVDGKVKGTCYWLPSETEADEGIVLIASDDVTVETLKGVAGFLTPDHRDQIRQAQLSPDAAPAIRGVILRALDEVGCDVSAVDVLVLDGATVRRFGR